MRHGAVVGYAHGVTHQGEPGKRGRTAPEHRSNAVCPSQFEDCSKDPPWKKGARIVAEIPSFKFPPLKKGGRGDLKRSAATQLKTAAFLDSQKSNLPVAATTLIYLVFVRIIHIIRVCGEILLIPILVLQLLIFYPHAQWQ